MNEEIYQILTLSRHGYPVLQKWCISKDAAEKELQQCKEFWPNSEFWIEPGTDYINNKCRGCGPVHAIEQHDHYGISTGYWCDSCYNSSKYPYRKDAYFDPSYAGERLDDDY